MKSSQGTDKRTDDLIADLNYQHHNESKRPTQPSIKGVNGGGFTAITRHMRSIQSQDKFKSIQ
jgi:hypothetical protein